MNIQPLTLAQWPSLTDAEAAQVVGGAQGPWTPFWKKAVSMAIEAVLETALKEWRKRRQEPPRGGGRPLPG